MLNYSISEPPPRSGFEGLKIFFHPPRPWKASRLAKGAASGAENPTRMWGPTNGRCQSLNQTVELRSLRLERSQVIMPTAHSSPSKEVVTAALLLIGGKILSGRTKDQNINYIAEYLAAVGINLREVRVVGDEERAIIDALNALRRRYTYVFTTGGIGPDPR